MKMLAQTNGSIVRVFRRTRIALVLFGILIVSVVCGLAAPKPARAELVSGNIAVYNGATLLGYVRNTYDGQNSYTYTSNAADALVVQFDSAASAPFAITVLNPPGAYPYFGAVGGSGGYNFGPGQLGYAYLSGTGLTPAGSPPSFTAGHDIQALGYNAPAESSIWSRSGNTLSAQWVNTDGSVHPAQFFYDAGVDFLAITQDFNKFVETFPGEGAKIVTFQFTGTIPPPTPVAATATSLTSSLNPSGVGQNVTFTATVTNTAVGGATPTGSVAFVIDGSTATTGALNASGKVSYTTSTLSVGAHEVVAQFLGSTSFAASTSNTVNQNVIGAPTANSQSVSTSANTPVGITLTGSDPNSPPRSLTYTIVGSPSHGTLSGTAPNLTYTPSAGYTGADSFTFKVSNGVVDSNVATVSITITDTVAPTVTASADKTTLFPPNGKSVPVTVTGTVTDSGSGVDRSSGAYTVTDSEGTSIPGGTFTINPDGTYAFTLPLVASRKGTSKDDRVYTITVTAKDNAGNTGSATVSVTVPHDRGK